MANYFGSKMAHLMFCITINYLFLGIATELDNTIDQYLVMGVEGSFQCVGCGFSGKKRNVRNHIEARHMTNTHVSCSVCGKVVKTRDSLRKHMEKEHREWMAAN